MIRAMRIATALVILAMTVGTAVAGESRSIAVVGGGGMIGQRIVREALDRGHEVRLIARDPARITEKHARLEIVEGDVLDSAGLARLVAGQDVLVSAVGAARASTPDYTLYRRAAESLVTSLRGLGERAPRLIVVGGVGSLEDATGGLLLERVPEERRPEHLGQKAALDFYRAVQDVRWTYLSPPERIAPGERTGAYRTGLDEPVRDAHGQSRISMEDYAVAMIDEVEKPAHIGHRFTVGY